jgi:anti-sigma factor RsiW
MPDEWTDRLSEYLDGELPDGDRWRLDAHLVTCAACARTLDELRTVKTQATALTARPPARDLWPGIDAALTAAAGPRRLGHGRRVIFAAWQLAAAAVLIAVVSAALAWQIRGSRLAKEGSVATRPAQVADRGPDVQVRPVDLGDAQYDAAVADLQRALEKGRSRLDPATVAILEQNLQIIDRAIVQAQEALSKDPANSYVSGHLVEARRRKLELLRRATALVSDTN